MFLYPCGYRIHHAPSEKGSQKDRVRRLYRRFSTSLDGHGQKPFHAEFSSMPLCLDLFPKDKTLLAKIFSKSISFEEMEINSRGLRLFSGKRHLCDEILSHAVETDFACLETVVYPRC